MKLPRMPMLSRKHRVLVMAVAVGLGGAMAAHYALTRSLQEQTATRHATLRVVVARDELPAGALITADTVSVREVPAEWAQSTALKPDEFGGVENARLKNPVGKGEMIMWSMIEKPADRQMSSVVDRGRRAVTVPVDEISSLSGMLQPGDLIDLIVSADREERVVSFPLLQQVRVLATGSQMRAVPGGEDGGAQQRLFTTITLDTTPEEARRVIAARDAGRLTAILRNPEDKQPIGDYRLSMTDLLGNGAKPAVAARKGSAPSAGLRIIYGDKL